jgi:hypothetical protein
MASAAAVGRAAIVVHYYQRAAAAQFEDIATARAIAPAPVTTTIWTSKRMSILVSLGSYYGMPAPEGWCLTASIGLSTLGKSTTGRRVGTAESGNGLVQCPPQ